MLFCHPVHKKCLLLEEIFMLIRLAASDIAMQLYPTLSDNNHSASVRANIISANIISLCRRRNVIFAWAKISRRA